MQVDPDKAFAVQVAHEEGVLTTSAAYMQCALLYTSSSGERRIRCAALAATRARRAPVAQRMLRALLCTWLSGSSARCTLSPQLLAFRTLTPYHHLSCCHAALCCRSEGHVTELKVKQKCCGLC